MQAAANCEILHLRSAQMLKRSLIGLTPPGFGFEINGLQRRAYGPICRNDVSARGQLRFLAKAIVLIMSLSFVKNTVKFRYSRDWRSGLQLIRKHGKMLKLCW